jgi:hypothetical protein
MVGPLCPFCLTSNIPGTQLCIKCGKPVARIAMDYIMKEAEETKKELKEMKGEELAVGCMHVRMLASYTTKERPVSTINMVSREKK